MTPEPETVRIWATLPRELVARLDRYWHQHALRSRGETVERLLHAALDRVERSRTEARQAARPQK